MTVAQLIQQHLRQCPDGLHVGDDAFIICRNRSMDSHD